VESYIMPNENKGEKKDWNDDEETIINFSAQAQAAKAAQETPIPPPGDDLGLGTRDLPPALGDNPSEGLVFADPAALQQEPLLPPDAPTSVPAPPVLQRPSLPVQPQPSPPQVTPSIPPLPSASRPQIDPPTRMDVPVLASIPDAPLVPDAPCVPPVNIDAPTQNEVTRLDKEPDVQGQEKQGKKTVVQDTGEVIVAYPDPNNETVDAVAFLVIMKTPSVRLHQMFRLDKEKMDIGRAFDTPIFLDDKTVSLRHAAIRYEKVGNKSEFVLYDLAALNGTYLNGAQVYRSTLKDGDRISIGLTELVFKRV
jgi:hypothetical protein